MDGNEKWNVPGLKLLMETCSEMGRLPTLSSLPRLRDWFGVIFKTSQERRTAQGNRSAVTFYESLRSERHTSM